MSSACILTPDEPALTKARQRGATRAHRRTFVSAPRPRLTACPLRFAILASLAPIARLPGTGSPSHHHPSHGFRTGKQPDRRHAQKPVRRVPRGGRSEAFEQRTHTSRRRRACRRPAAVMPIRHRLKTCATGSSSRSRRRRCRPGLNLATAEARRRRRHRARSSRPRALRRPASSRAACRPRRRGPRAA